MRYQISGKQIDIGEALQTHVKAEIGEIIEKYAQRPTDAHVVFSRAGHELVCEATIHLSTGLTAKAEGHSPEIYAAFESCREKMDKQMRRYKRRLRNHHATRTTPISSRRVKSRTKAIMPRCNPSSWPRWRRRSPRFRSVRR